MVDVVRVRADILEEMFHHALREPEIECCGLLAGREDVITAIFPVKNALASGTAYEIAPKELFRCFRMMRVQGLDHLGLYHSHPVGENAPSPRDIEQAYYPRQAYFIISPRLDAPHPIRTFVIRERTARELEIVVVR